MKISVLGLGSVGAVTAGCLAMQGHNVIGIDPERAKVDAVNAGRSPVHEKDLSEIVREQVSEGRLCATVDVDVAVRQSDLLMICAETPGRANGELDLTHVKRVCEQVGGALRFHSGAPVVAVRSSLLPGSMVGTVIPALESRAAKKAGTDFGVCINPEFLREGSAVHDFFNPPKIVIGELNKASGDRLLAVYAGLPAPTIRTDIPTAEMAKYADNIWHAIKVAFANELGVLCKGVDVDAHRVMEVFCQDAKLNLSGAYLRPGFAFGGPSLPKDVRALVNRARSLSLNLPLLESILTSNALQVARGVQAVIDQGHRRVGLLGLAFKAGTDDLRESPMVELAQRLIAKGFELRIHDRHVRIASLQGTNRDFVLHRIPQIAQLVTADIDEVLGHAGTLVIGNSDPEYRDLPRRMADHQMLIDFVRICDSRSIQGVYEGLCW